MRSLLLLALALPLAGCTINSSTASEPTPPPTSSSLATNAMWPSMSAQSDGQTLRIYAALLKGSDFVQLDDGDFLTATVGDQSIVLSREPYVEGKIHYFATFPAPVASADVVIDFHRTAGHQAATSKTVVPASFEITSPAPVSVHVGSKLTINVQPPPITSNDATDRMTLAFNGDCLATTDPIAVKFDSEGSTTFDMSQLVLNKGATGCSLGVEVRHETSGPSDSAYASASGNPVAGLQARSFATSLVP